MNNKNYNIFTKPPFHNQFFRQMSKKKILILASALIVYSGSTSLFSGDQKLTPASVYKSDTISKRKLYRQFNLEEAPISSYPNFVKSCGSYKYGNLILLFGHYINEPYSETDKYNCGYRLLAINHKNELIFESYGSGTTRTFYPVFYKLDSKSPILVLVDHSDEGGSWGNQVFSIMDGVVKEIGFIRLAVFHSNGFETILDDISEVMTIEQIGDTLRFDFNADTLEHISSDASPHYIKAKDWYYLYDNKTLKLIKK